MQNPHLTDEQAKAQKEEEIGGFRELPAHEQPSEPTLRSQSPPCVLRPRAAHGGCRTNAQSCREREAGAQLLRPCPCMWSPAIYLKMLHQLLGLDLDDNVILHKLSLQHLLVGQPERGLAPGTDGDLDGKLLHRSPRGPGCATSGNNKQTNGK